MALVGWPGLACHMSQICTCKGQQCLPAVLSSSCRAHMLRAGLSSTASCTKTHASADARLYADGVQCRQDSYGPACGHVRSAEGQVSTPLVDYLQSAGHLCALHPAMVLQASPPSLHAGEHLHDLPGKG